MAFPRRDAGLSLMNERNREEQGMTKMFSLLVTETSNLAIKHRLASRADARDMLIMEVLKV